MEDCEKLAWYKLKFPEQYLRQAFPRGEPEVWQHLIPLFFVFYDAWNDYLLLLFFVFGLYSYGFGGDRDLYIF